MASVERPSSLILYGDFQGPLNVNELKSMLQSKDISSKIDALKQIIIGITNGENLAGLFMTVIQNVITQRDHTLKKLLLLYWEVIEKRNPDGVLKQEMIMVCNGLLGNLQHPNEYVRGMTLRFMAKVKESELLESLLKAIRENLTYSHPYVRRNAVLAVASIYKNDEALIPDAPELIDDVLEREQDPTVRRNAFVMLVMIDQARAVKYLNTLLEDVSSLDVSMQLAVIDLIGKVSKFSPQERGRYTRAIVTLLSSQKSFAVKFEAALVLVGTTSSTAAIKQAAQCFIDILNNESDNNIKLIVLEKLSDLKREHETVLQDLLMDMLRALSTPNIEIRRKLLALAMDLLSQRNISEVVGVLKKELMKTQVKDAVDRALDYRQILIQAIHGCADRFPEVADSVVYVLMEFLGDASGAASASAAEAVTFVREVLEIYPNLRQNLLNKLFDTFPNIKSPRVFRAVLWLCGEYAYSGKEIATAFSVIKTSLGDLPFSEMSAPNVTASSAPSTPRTEEMSRSMPTTSAQKVLPDGTYASQTALPGAAKTEQGGQYSSTPSVSLRSLICSGDYFLGTAVAAALTKLVLRSSDLTESEVSTTVKSLFGADVMLYLTSIALLGRKADAQHRIDDDCFERIMSCIKVLSNPTTEVKKLFLEYCRTSFSKVLLEKREHDKAEKAREAKKSDRIVQPDSLISFRQLRSRGESSGDLGFDDEDIGRATGSTDSTDIESKRLSCLHQLTGLADPIYCEAAVLPHQYDIVLEFLLVNRTNETLTNVSVELSALGDLRVTDRPGTLTLGARESKRVKASLKVTSTESGIIFGSIAYDRSGSRATDQHQVVLNDIRVDIIDYITPKHCSDTSFRMMWQDFEWENKVTINTHLTDVQAYLQHMMKITNMRPLADYPRVDGPSDVSFLTANLYAKSIFDEDILANVSVERGNDGRLTGFVRIRSKTQGVAVGIGERITLKQRG